MREPGDEDDTETPLEYARELIRELREKIASGQYAMPPPTGDKSGYNAYAAEEARKRLVPSTRPVRTDFDSEERWLEAQRQWHTKKAKDMGWLEK